MVFFPVSTYTQLFLLHLLLLQWNVFLMMYWLGLLEEQTITTDTTFESEELEISSSAEPHSRAERDEF